MSENQRIVDVDIEKEMKSAYIDYSMSVIVARALPDVRDGLKPVHRRILYAMNELGLQYNKAHKKSARVVGEVLGKYHPHGDTSVYDAMVRLAQDWSLRYTMIDGQGNFGHIDGDGPAAMRYTEARLERMAHEMIHDIDKETVDMQLNFDDSLEEPTVLPTKIPNLLVNGASGIAVGMATNMLPHNLTEVIGGVIAMVKNPDISTEELMTYIQAPDLPTGGVIYGLSGIKDAYETGRGKMIVRAKATIEESDSQRNQIIITEIPYQVSLSSIEQKIAELVKTEKITGIHAVRNESDRTSGLRLAIDLKNDAIPNVVLSNLFKLTPLQSSYGINNIALVNGRPKQLGLRPLVSEFIKFRKEVIVRRTIYDLKKAEEKAHILEGLLIAIDNLDEVIQIIRSSKTVEEARIRLIERFLLSEIQARAILDMRLMKLTGLERFKVKEEYEELQVKITDYKDILATEQRQYDIIIFEAKEILEKFGDKRRTSIVLNDAEITIEDQIPNDEVIVTISHLGYIKRTKSSEYKIQARGGRGSLGSKTRDQDAIEHLFVANNHNYLLLFTEQGKCYWVRVYEIPEATKNSMGRVIQNLLAIPTEDKVKAYIKIDDLNNEEFLSNHYLIFATKKGLLKKTSIKEYSRPRTNGINAITINENDQLLVVKLTDGNSEIMLANKMGRAVRFKETDVRPTGRNSAGVKGMTLLSETDELVGLVTMTENEKLNHSILAITENGYGKRTMIDEYRITTRGGKGVKNIQLTEKNGLVLSINSVEIFDHLMVTTKNGVMIRMTINNIREMSRATQGVKLISLSKGDSIADLTILNQEESEDGSTEE